MKNNDYFSERSSISMCFKDSLRKTLLIFKELLTLSQLYSSANAEGYNSFSICLDQVEKTESKELSIISEILSEFIIVISFPKILGMAVPVIEL